MREREGCLGIREKGKRLKSVSVTKMVTGCLRVIKVAIFVTLKFFRGNFIK